MSSLKRKHTSRSRPLKWPISHLVPEHRSERNYRRVTGIVEIGIWKCPLKPVDTSMTTTHQSTFELVKINQFVKNVIELRYGWTNVIYHSVPRESRQNCVKLLDCRKRKRTKTSKTLLSRTSVTMESYLSEMLSVAACSLRHETRRIDTIYEFVDKAEVMDAKFYQIFSCMIKWSCMKDRHK